MKHKLSTLLLSVGLLTVTTPLLAASNGDNNGKPFQELNAIIDSNRALIDENKADITALQSDVADIGNGLASLQSDLLNLEGRVATNEGEIATLQSRVGTLEGDYNLLNAELAQLRADHDTDMVDINTAISSAESNIAALESDLLSLTTALNAQLADLVAAVGDNAIAIDAMELELTATTALALSNVIVINGLQDDVNDLKARAAAHESSIDDLQAQIDALDSRLVVVENETHSDDEGLCFSLSNTPAEDLVGSNWFDACVDAQQAGATTVRLVLKNASNAIVYDQAGAIVGQWTYNMVTSTSTKFRSLFNVSQHDQLITLANGDTLMIPGKWASNAGCGGDRANGYVILVAPNPNERAWDQKMLVTTYSRPNQASARSFTGWTAANEISWNNGSSFNTCVGVGSSAYEGTFEVYVY